MVDYSKRRDEELRTRFRALKRRLQKANERIRRLPEFWSGGYKMAAMLYREEIHQIRRALYAPGDEDRSRRELIEDAIEKAWRDLCGKPEQVRLAKKRLAFLQAKKACERLDRKLDMPTPDEVRERIFEKVENLVSTLPSEILWGYTPVGLPADGGGGE